jgi:L-cysteate sulfo-lyase
VIGLLSERIWALQPILRQEVSRWPRSALRRRMIEGKMNILFNFEKYPLLEGSTPIQRLWRLEQALGCGVHIYVKRDDLMGLGGGGNKLRKLEFLIGEAKSKGYDTIITTGGL